MHETMSDKAKIGMTWYVAAFVYAAGEPGDNPVGIEKVMQETISALGAMPRNILRTSTGGKAGRFQRFTLDNCATLIRDPQSVSLTMLSLQKSAAFVNLRLFLRHNPAVLMKFRSPKALYVVMECGGPMLAPTVAQYVAQSFLRTCAAELSVLHGGVAAFPNRNQALSEAALTGIDLSNEPESFERRWDYDARNSRSLWQKARRVFWLNLLGPDLAQKVGGPAAANAAGAMGVEEVQGSLIFAATSNIEDSLDPHFSDKTSKLTEWLWPYLLQNPY